MKHSIILISIFSTFLFSCSKETVIINKDLLLGDWESIEDIYNNVYYLTIEDSLLRETITHSANSVIPYTVLFDTLIFTPHEYYVYEHRSTTYETDKKTKIFKYKILSLDSLRLVIIPIFPILRDTLFFNKIILEKKNDLKIDKLEFYSRACFGECPEQSIYIDSDSILYHFSNGHYTKHKGLTKHKLNSVEYTRILDRLNSIERDQFKLCICPPDAPGFGLYIKSQCDSVEISGTFCHPKPNYVEIDYRIHDDEYSSFINFICYLGFLERFLNLEPANEQEICFRFKL